jgi:tRNA threonylcarbamoyladenosine biosynthesis protein TsaE
MKEPAAISERGQGTVELDQAGLEAWASALGRAAVASGTFVCLVGPLGAGKSTLVRAACRAVGVSGTVPSPTFTLVIRHETPSGESVWHADLYRLEDPAQLVNAGWPELLEDESAVFVEWAERAGAWLPSDRWEIRIGFTDRPDRRRVEVRSVGAVSPPPSPGASPC